MAAGRASREPRRVVITGAGINAPIGNDLASVTEALREGRSAVRRMPEWDFIEELQGKLGATVENLDLLKRYPRKKRRTMGRLGLLATHATEQAIEQAGLTEELVQHPRTGLAYGSTSGSSHALESYCGPLMVNKSMRGLDSSAYLKFMTHTAAANLASFLGVRGRILPTCSACTSGSQAVGYAYETIKYGLMDRMIAGGAEEMHYMTGVTFDLLMAASTRYNADPERSPRPFDADRDGLVIGEGAGTLILESIESARERGAPILGEVLGFATNCDGGHLTQPSQEGMQAVMALALEDAGLPPERIEYINAHGTGTPIGDVAESHATFALFGGDVPVSSTKSYTGHTLGACGAQEAIYCLLMMREGFLVKNRNLERVDPECAPLSYLRETREARPKITMSNNFAFGGVNTSLIFGTVET